MASRTLTNTDESLADQAYVALRDRLLTLQIAPGDAINEDQLRTELGLGRTPVREAIKRLALEDLIDVFPRRGTFASEIQITDLAAISEIRRELEGYAAELAAQRLLPAGEAEIEDLLIVLDSVERSAQPPEKMRLDADVHRLVYRATRNAYLEATLTRFFNLSIRIWYLVLDRLPETYSVDEHRQLLQAILRRDPAASRRIAAQHVENFAQAVRSVI